MSVPDGGGPRVTWEPEVAAKLNALLAENPERFANRPLMVALVGEPHARCCGHCVASVCAMQWSRCMHCTTPCTCHWLSTDCAALHEQVLPRASVSSASLSCLDVCSTALTTLHSVERNN
jgi:hypothetical protein